MEDNKRGRQECKRWEELIQDFAGRSDQQREALRGYGSYSASTRQTKVDFPRFAGDDLRGWLYKSENFFERNGTPWDRKVMVAAVHLEGQALQWHQIYMLKRMTRDMPQWEEYVLALHARFEVTAFEDSMAELVTWRQTGEQEECLETFDSLVGWKRSFHNQHNTNLNQSQESTYTYGGANPTIAGAQQRFPAPSKEIQKSSTLAGILPTPKQQIMTPKGEGRVENTPSRWLRSDEMDDTPEITTRDDEIPVDKAYEHIPEANLQLSLCALTGDVQELRCNILRVTEQITPVFVTVAKGERSICKKVCRAFSTVIQDNEFSACIFLLRLGGGDMVLSIEWLVTLRDIIGNLQEFTMRFTYEGRVYLFRGSMKFKRKGIGVHEMQKSVQRAPCSSDSLTSYLDVFAEPKEFTTKFVKKGQQHSLQASRVNREESRGLLDDDDWEWDEEEKEGLSFVEKYGLDWSEGVRSKRMQTENENIKFLVDRRDWKFGRAMKLSGMQFSEKQLLNILHGLGRKGKLEIQIDIFDAEIEGLSVKKGKNRPHKLTHSETSIARHKAHIMKLELNLRFLDNDELSPEQVNDVKDYLDDYVERNQEDFDKFSDVGELYNFLPLDKVDALEELVAVITPGILKGTLVNSLKSSSAITATQTTAPVISNIQQVPLTQEQAEETNPNNSDIDVTAGTPAKTIAISFAVPTSAPRESIP